MSQTTDDTSASSLPRGILLCACPEEAVLDPDKLQRMREILRAQDLAWIEVPDLCFQVASNPEWLRDAGGPMAVIACHARAARGLLRAAGAAWAADAEFHDLRADRPETIASNLRARVDPQATRELAAGLAPARARAKAMRLSSAWPAWFPVIDRQRCVDCGRCFEFCVFGVYTRDAAGRVEVTNPAACKNLCPACARLCPEVALIFPRLREEPLAGGEIDARNLRGARVRLDPDAFKGESLRQALAARRDRRRLFKHRPASPAAEQENTTTATGSKCAGCSSRECSAHADCDQDPRQRG